MIKNKHNKLINNIIKDDRFYGKKCVKKAKGFEDFGVMVISYNLLKDHVGSLSRGLVMKKELFAEV